MSHLRPCRLVLSSEGPKLYAELILAHVLGWTYTSRYASWRQSLGFTNVTILDDDDAIADYLGLAAPTTSAQYGALFATLMAHGFDGIHVQGATVGNWECLGGSPGNRTGDPTQRTPPGVNGFYTWPG